MAYLRWCATLSAVGGLLTSLPSQAAVFSTAFIAVSGDMAPDANGTYRDFTAPGFNSPMLSDSGQASFIGVLHATANGLSDNTGIFRGNGSALIQVVREGESAPDGDGVYSTFSTPAINNSGQIAFQSQLIDTAVGGQGSVGIFRGSGGAIDQIARAWQIAPDGNGRLSSFGNAYVNDSGQVAFRAGLTGTSDGNDDNEAILRGNGNALATMVREGQAAPGGGRFSNFGDPLLNQTGEVAFWAALIDTIGGFSDDAGIFVANGITVSAVVREGQSTPDGRGGFSLFPHASFNNSGQTAFSAEVTGSAIANDFGIFRSDGSTLTQIVHERQSLPNGSLISISNFITMPAHVLNDVGQVTFVTEILSADGSQHNSYGIFRGDGASIKQLAVTGQAAPDGGSFSSFGFHALNNAGQVAFHASLDNAGDSGGSGLFFFDEQQGIIEVVRVGDSLLGSTITELNFSVESGVNNAGWRPLNENGQLAYHFTLADGRSGIAVAAIVPEPTTLILLLTPLVVGTVLRLRTRSCRSNS